VQAVGVDATIATTLTVAVPAALMRHFTSKEYVPSGVQPPIGLATQTADIGALIVPMFVTVAVLVAATPAASGEPPMLLVVPAY
jgi:hypothetical protein